MKRILVTGSRGFLGRNVVAEFEREGHRVYGIDTRPGDRPRDRVGDVTDPTFLRAAVVDTGAEQIVHLAAATIRGDGSASGFRLNVAGTQNVLDVACGRGVARVLVLSSTAVFGDRVFESGCLDEEAALAPIDSYGWSKVGAESLVALAQRRCPQTEVVVVRVPALFGPWEHETPWRFLMSPPLQLVRAAMAGESVVLAEGGARDWTYAGDVASGLVALLGAPRLEHSIYHLGCGEVWHLEALARALTDRNDDFTWSIATNSTTLAYGDDLTRHRSPLLADRVHAELGFIPSTPADACRRYLDWTEGHVAAVAPSGLIPPHTREK